MRKLAATVVSLLPLLGISFIAMASDGGAPMQRSLACPSSLFKPDGTGKHALFSAISLANSPFAKQWNAMGRDFVAKYPGLSFDPPSNLHITLVYIGKGWIPGRIDDLERLGLTSPPGESLPLSLTGTPEIFGKANDVVSLRLEVAPESWARVVIDNRLALSQMGLRKQDVFDSTFVPHVTLAKIRRGAADGPAQLRAFIEEFKALGSPRFTLGESDVATYFLSLPPHQVGDPMIYRPLMSLCKKR